MPDFSFALLRHRLAAARDQARRPRPAMAPDPRPEGRLLWTHVSDDTSAEGVRLVLEQVASIVPDLSLLTTGAGPHPWLTAPAPTDTPSDADVFLEQWAPDIALFVGGDMFPTLWTMALRRGVVCLAADAATQRQPSALIAPLARFDAVLAREPDSRLGPVCEVLGRLATTPMPPDAPPGAVAATASALATRPVWLALGVPETELDDVLTGHRRAARMSHRLLLLLDSPAAGTAAAMLDAGGWRWASRSAGEVPQGDTQVFLVSDDEAGVWLRLAPVAFLGGTLRGDGPTISPFAPAALGSAIVHGPTVGAAADAIARLLRAGATRSVQDAAELGDEVERLISPDAAAELALAGWGVTTDGALASARLVDLIDETMAGLE